MGTDAELPPRGAGRLRLPAGRRAARAPRGPRAEGRRRRGGRVLGKDAGGPRLRAADSPGRGPPLVVPGRRTVIDGSLCGCDLPAGPASSTPDAGAGATCSSSASRDGDRRGASPQAPRWPAQRNAGEVVDGSVLEMPFADDSFDLAVSLDVIEHLDDDLAALRELRRVVAPGGALLVTVPSLRVAVERPRRAQPPPPPLYTTARCAGSPSGPAGGRCGPPTSTRCCCRSRSCCGCSTASTPRPPSRASTCGCRRRPSTGCSSGRCDRGRRDRSRRAASPRACRCWPVPMRRGLRAAAGSRPPGGPSATPR